MKNYLYSYIKIQQQKDHQRLLNQTFKFFWILHWITSFLCIAILPFSPRVIIINFPRFFPKEITSSKFLASTRDEISCSFAKVISNLFLTKSRKCGLCLSTQNLSDHDIATFFEFLIAFSNAFFGLPSSQR